jgi:hypothetical protein
MISENADGSADESTTSYSGTAEDGEQEEKIVHLDQGKFPSEEQAVTPDDEEGQKESVAADSKDDESSGDDSDDEEEGEDENDENENTGQSSGSFLAQRTTSLATADLSLNNHPEDNYSAEQKVAGVSNIENVPRSAEEDGNKNKFWLIITSSIFIFGGIIYFMIRKYARVRT